MSIIKYCCCDLIIPVIMIIFGFVMYKRPPKRINHTVGFRTAMSMKNEDTWNYAHDRCGRLWVKAGIIMAVPSVLIQLPFLHASDNVMGLTSVAITTVQIIILIWTAVRVDKELKLVFDVNGQRK